MLGDWEHSSKTEDMLCMWKTRFDPFTLCAIPNITTYASHWQNKNNKKPKLETAPFP